MRQHLNQNKKAEGPLGIRNGVWFFGICSMLLCLLIISRHRPDETTGQIAAEVAEVIRVQDSSALAWRSVRSKARTDVRPERPEDSVGVGDEEFDLSIAEQLSQDQRTWIDYPVLTW